MFCALFRSRRNNKSLTISDSVEVSKIGPVRARFCFCHLVNTHAHIIQSDASKARGYWLVKVVGQKKSSTVHAFDAKANSLTSMYVFTYTQLCL